jgi:hypothetical protein
VSVAVSIVAPGAGLLYNDRIMEGLFYSASWLLLLLAFLIPRFFSFVALTAPIPVIVPIVGIALMSLLWLFGLFRSWRVAHNE